VSVRIERPADRVAELVMDRPEALNAVSTEQARAIAAACAELAADNTLSVVILSSALARAFCVGADLKERNTFNDAELAAHRPVTQTAYRGVLDLPMPTIAAVEGFALGGGCELALACDLIVASESAVFGLPEVGVGLVPGGGGTQLLRRRIGWNRAAELIFTARRIEVDEADRLGLVDRRAATGAARRDALELAQTIAANSPVGLRSAKWALQRGADVDLAAGLEIEDRAWRRTAFSADRVEGIAAFNAHRSPHWPGLQGESSSPR
jgi:enoyl-CoA hydratase/carnithine racemase